MVAANPLRVFFVGTLATTVTSFQTINAVWSTSGFSTISGPSGSESAHGDGFSLIDEDGNTIFSESSPNGYVPCQGDPGYTFTLSGGCFAQGQQYEFQCTSDFSGNPDSCKVLDSSSNTLATGEGDTDTDFVGIAVAQDGYCGTSFALNENVQCDPDSTGFTVF